MTTDWDPSRDYDSQTFSEDYNLHGASGRSLDHPSITRDHINILDLVDGEDDDDSIDNADLDLIADIVDGKAHQNRHQRTPAHWNARHADNNSTTSIMRYLLDGSQDPVEYQESPDFIPTRHNGLQMDRHRPLADDTNEDHFREILPGIPKRQTRSVRNKFLIRNAFRYPAWVNFSLEGFKSPASRFGAPARQGSGSGIPIASAIPRKTASDGTSAKKNVTVETPPKPIFRSAMKSTNGGANGNGEQPAKSKLGRHIQLPTEILSDSDESEQSIQESDHISSEDHHESEEYEQQQEQEPEQTEQVDIQEEQVDIQKDQEHDQDQEGDPSTDLESTGTVTQTTSSVPGPSRFTRITKKNVSPGKKSITTIPTPLDDGNEQVQKTIKELKTLLGRLGLLPLSHTLESSLDELDVAAIEKGGLCEAVNLLQRLGGMCEKQKEVIHQMTDQIIANEMQTERDPEAEERIQDMAQELKDVRAELDQMKKRNQMLESNSADLEQRLEQLQTAKEEILQPTEQTRERLLIDAESQVSGNWGSIEELLDQKANESRNMISKKQLQQSGPTSAYWKAHIQRIEKELHELKAKLERQPASSSPLPEMAMNTDELGDMMNEILLDNRRLKQKNKSLTKELLRTQEADSADEHKRYHSKYKVLLKNVMARLGVDNQQDILPALNEIERIIRDLPNLRRFVAKAERIIWESEIIEGSVRVQKYLRSRVVGGTETPEQGVSEVNAKSEGGLIIKVGRTCSQSYEETLQRLKEWSELLDVLNHVEFADDIEDESTFAAAAAQPSS
ncbi:hypothetical protein BGX27_005602 [Mortierella sp. AM989]|nr:hypothetical protein BGX27_005602 [Mortierella sp. AM989]